MPCGATAAGGKRGWPVRASVSSFIRQGKGEARVGEAASPLRAGSVGGLETDPQTRTERPANMALLFFGGYFAGDLKGRLAGDAADAADPAARAVIWNKREGRTILERRLRTE